MKDSNVKIHFSKKKKNQNPQNNPKKNPAVADLQSTFWERKNKKKEEHKHKYSVRQHYVATSCLAAFNMADLSNRPSSLRWKGPIPVSK